MAIWCDDGCSDDVKMRRLDDTQSLKANGWDQPERKGGCAYVNLKIPQIFTIT